MPREILLVRHAQSENNAAHGRAVRDLGHDRKLVIERIEQERHPDPELTALGKEQIQSLAMGLGPRLRGRNPLIVASPMVRALDTAQALFDASEMPRDRFWCHPDLFEVGGTFYQNEAREGKRPEEIEDLYAARCHDFPKGTWHPNPSGRETRHEANIRIARVRRWAESLLSNPSLDVDPLVIVCHGDLMTRWIRQWVGVPMGQHITFMHENTGITRMSWCIERGIILRSHNDVRHLPEAQRTGDSDTWWHYGLPELEIRKAEGLSALDPTERQRLMTLRRRVLGRDEDVNDAQGIHLVALNANEINGAIHLDTAEGRIRHLIVDESNQGQGIGRRLVARARMEARKHGAQKMSVVSPRELDGYFRSLGFEDGEAGHLFVPLT